MYSTETRMQKLLAANTKVLARIDRILSGEDEKSGNPEIDLSTCTLTDAARRTRLSRPTIYRLIKAGRLRTVDLNGVKRVLLSSLAKHFGGDAA